MLGAFAGVDSFLRSPCSWSRTSWIAGAQGGQMHTYILIYYIYNMGLVGINTKTFENDVSNILVGFPDPERHIPDPSIGGGKPSNKP